MTQRGRFITLEGGEGAGKSTQAKRLAAALAAAGLPVLRTREPGGTPGAERIRDLLLGHGPWDSVAEAMLHFAARREHLVGTIRPFLESGGWVVCDRFADSTLAYQGAQGLKREVWARLAEVALEGFAPDVTLVLDLPVAAGMARAAARSGADRYERMDEAFHARVREGFLAIAAAEPARCAVVDASRAADVVFDDMVGLLRERVGARL
ncbi:dTMP kinase [Roseomonas eburnea]|uniref:Thymidylate kinase n=1 Tax=Neoroseomonas eburnea TaxID=1346889 RepID=A0A9X9X5X9_9PROT|nr:dTMP kinase [Neoroseomonas eburnea]MBR0679115.1 dTMP kinase [Neoroseomonas eburnea]